MEFVNFYLEFIYKYTAIERPQYDLKKCLNKKILPAPKLLSRAHTIEHENINVLCSTVVYYDGANENEHEYGEEDELFRLEEARMN